MQHPNKSVYLSTETRSRGEFSCQISNLVCFYSASYFNFFLLLISQVGKKGSQRGYFNLISSVTVGPSGEIIVADSRIQVFSAKGDFLEELYPEGKG